MKKPTILALAALATAVTSTAAAVTPSSSIVAGSALSSESWTGIFTNMSFSSKASLVDGPNTTYQYAYSLTDAGPFSSAAARNSAFTFAVYADVSMMVSSSTAYPIIASFGNKNGNQIMLYRNQDTINLAFVNGGAIIGNTAGDGGSAIAASIDISSLPRSFHLWTAVCDPTTGGVTLYLDGGATSAVVEGSGAVEMPTGFQIGSTFYGNNGVFAAGIGMMFVAMNVYDEALTAEDVASLAETYPAVSIPTWSAAAGAYDLSTAENWSGETCPESGDVCFHLQGDTTITVDSTVAYSELAIKGSGSLTFVTGAGAMTVDAYMVASGATLVFDPNGELSIATPISGSGAVSVASGTVSFSVASSFTGGLTVKSGALAKATVSNGAGANGSTITVEDGGTFDLNGIANLSNLRIAGSGVNSQGAVINSGDNIPKGNAQLRSITLLGDATIVNGQNHNWGLINNSNGATKLDLGSYKLTKKGAGSFWVCNTTISGSGTIDIEAGSVVTIQNGSTASAGVLLVRNGGLLLLEGASMQVSILTNEVGGTINVQSGKTLTINSQYTENNATTLNGNIVCGGLALGESGSFVINSTGSFTLNNVDWTSDIGDVFSGTGTLVLNSTGSKHAHTVSTSFNGILKLAGNNQNILGNDSSSGIFKSGATPELVLDGTTTMYLTPYYDSNALEIRDLSGSATIDARYNGTARDQKVITTQTKDTLFSGIFNGAGVRKNSLTVQGDGGTVHSLTLAGASTTAGTLTVDEGAKVVFASAGNWDDGSVVVNEGAYLESTNSSAVTTLTLNSGSTLVAPAASSAPVTLVATNVIANGTIYLDIADDVTLTSDSKLLSWTTYTPTDAKFIWAGDAPSTGTAGEYWWPVVNTETGYVGVEASSGVAHVDGVVYDTLSAAITAAQSASDKTVYFLKAAGDSETSVEVPEGVTLNLGSYTLACSTLTINGEVDATAEGSVSATTLSGTGTLIYTGCFPNSAVKTLVKASAWSGTLMIADYYIPDSTHLVMSELGNDNSTVAFRNVSAWSFAKGDNFEGSVRLVDDGVNPALTARNGYGNANNAMGALKGDGDFWTIRTPGANQIYRFTDGSEYTGSISNVNQVVVFGDSSISGTYTHTRIDSGYTAALGDGALWYSGTYTISGTLIVQGSGSLSGTVTFDDGASLVFNGWTTEKYLALSKVPTFSSGTVYVSLGDGVEPIDGSTLISWPEETIPAGKFKLRDSSEYKLVKTSTGVVFVRAPPFILKLR